MIPNTSLFDVISLFYGLLACTVSNAPKCIVGEAPRKFSAIRYFTYVHPFTYTITMDTHSAKRFHNMYMYINTHMHHMYIIYIVYLHLYHIYSGDVYTCICCICTYNFCGCTVLYAHTLGSHACIFHAPENAINIVYLSHTHKTHSVTYRCTTHTNTQKYINRQHIQTQTL